MKNTLISPSRLSFAAIALTLGGMPAVAEEVTTGTVLDASSIDQLQDMTLQGHRIGDMITPGNDRLIRKHGFRMTLQPRSKPLLANAEVLRLTELHKGEASLDDQGRLVGHTTGLPFPDIDVNDPDAGIKLTYNILRTGWIGDTMDLNPMYFLVIDGKKGLQREQGWRFKRYLMTGRISEPHTIDPELVKYESLINLYPQDTRGVGILTVNYTDARLADVYAYIKSLRRVRRLSSGAWADPVSATDLLTDETFAINLDPTWYDSWELQGKRWVLGSSESKITPLNLDAKDPATRFPAMILDEAPYWNYKEEFSPQESYVLKGVPPKSHLNGHRIMYVGTNPGAPLFWGSEYYDKKGELWRALNISFNQGEWDNGQTGPKVTMVWVADVQRLHATVLYQGDDWRYSPDADPADFTPEALPRQLN